MLSSLVENKDTSALQWCSSTDVAVLYISLNQCSLEHGLGTLAGERDRLASDEPNASLPSPP